LAPSATPAEALVQAEALLAGASTRLVRPRPPRARGPRRADGARYFEARIAAAQGRFSVYRAGLSELGRRGTSPWKGRALLDLAKNVEGVPSASTLDAYRRYRIATGAAADPLALLREGWAAYELARLAEAQAGFARALAHPEAPDGVRVTAMYWQARLDDQAAHAAQARDGFKAVASSTATTTTEPGRARLKLPGRWPRRTGLWMTGPRRPGGVWLRRGVFRLGRTMGRSRAVLPGGARRGGAHAMRIAVEAAEQAQAAAAPRRRSPLRNSRQRS
jgi:hypothetical protein